MSGVWDPVVGSLSEVEKGPVCGRGEVPTREGLDIA